MTKEKKLNIAKALTVQLHATEEAIDTALTEAAQLIETYVTSRRAINASTVLGTETRLHTLEAMKALNLAQTHMSAAHSGLVDVQKQIGLGTIAIGPFDKPEKDGKDDTQIFAPADAMAS